MLLERNLCIDIRMRKTNFSLSYTVTVTVFVSFLLCISLDHIALSLNYPHKCDVSSYCVFILFIYILFIYYFFGKVVNRLLGSSPSLEFKLAWGVPEYQIGLAMNPGLSWRPPKASLTRCTWQVPGGDRENTVSLKVIPGSEYTPVQTQCSVILLESQEMATPLVLWARHTIHSPSRPRDTSCTWRSKKTLILLIEITTYVW